MLSVSPDRFGPESGPDSKGSLTGSLRKHKSLGSVDNASCPDKSQGKEQDPRKGVRAQAKVRKRSIGGTDPIGGGGNPLLWSSVSPV